MTTVSRAELLRVLRRTGNQAAADRIAALGDSLPDPIDVDQHRDLLLEHGVTRGSLIDAIGGSP